MFALWKSPRLVALVLVASWFPTASDAQIPFWNESFDNGCTQLCPGDGFTGANGMWTVTDLSPPGTAANIWYVSCAENGNPEGTCGSGCGGNATAHVGNVSNSPAAFIFCPTGDCGAAYDTSGPSVVANKRLVSPPIDTTGLFNLTATFLYLGDGQPCLDSADFDLSVDGGLGWTTLSACLTTVNGACFPQGMWSLHTVALPVAAENNADVRVGFRWRNNGDFGGSDPSFAVDNLTLLSGMESVCGNAIPEAGEECDDGNPDLCDGCRPDCTAERCGDRIPDCLEECDDGNNLPGDGCAPDCTLESCGLSLPRMTLLRAIKDGIGGADFHWTPEAGSPEYHLNSVTDKLLLIDPRRSPGNGSPECEATPPDAWCPDSDAIGGPPRLFYQVLSACGPGGLNEGPY